MGFFTITPPATASKVFNKIYNVLVQIVIKQEYFAIRDTMFICRRVGNRTGASYGKLKSSYVAGEDWSIAEVQHIFKIQYVRNGNIDF